MFDLSDKRMVWIPVRWAGVQAKDKDGVAENVEHEIECNVELLDREKLKDLFQPELPDDDDPTPAELHQRDLDKFLGVVHDWRGVKNGEQSAPFNKDNASKIMRVPMFAAGFEDSYTKAWAGQIELREKNSVGSSAIGSAGGRRARTTRRR